MPASLTTCRLFLPLRALWRFLESSMKNRASGFSGTFSGPSGQDPPSSRYWFGLGSRSRRFGIETKLRHRQTASGRCSRTAPRPPSQAPIPLNDKNRPTPQQRTTATGPCRYSRAVKPRCRPVPECPDVWTMRAALPFAGCPVFWTHPPDGWGPVSWAYSLAPVCLVFRLRARTRRCPVNWTAPPAGLRPACWTQNPASGPASPAPGCPVFRIHLPGGGVCPDVWTRISAWWRKYFLTQSGRSLAALISYRAGIQQETPLQDGFLGSSGRAVAITDLAFRACGTSIPKGKKIQWRPIAPNTNGRH